MNKPGEGHSKSTSDRDGVLLLVTTLIQRQGGKEVRSPGGHLP